MLGKLLHRFFGHWSTFPGASILVPSQSGSIPLVDADTALQYTPVYRAVSLIANDLARVDCSVSNQVVDALLRSPNRYISGFEFRRLMTMQCALYGNAFALINRTRSGDLLELIPLGNHSVTLDLTGPEPIYRSSLYGELRIEQVLHFRTMGYGGLWGESPARLCNAALTVMAAQEQSQLKSMENAGQPKLALVHPGALNDKQRQMVAEQYVKQHAGSVNAGRPLVLGDNMRVERISSTFDNDGIDAARRYSIQDVSRIFGVPVSYLSEHSQNAYGSMEWLGRMYVDHCIEHWAAVWRSEILAKLASPFDTVSFDLDALQRPSLAEQMAALRTGVEAGFITRNEARARLDLDPLPGLDEPIVAKNMGTGGGTTNLGADTSAQEGTPNDF
jgi:HK97 family phage portal protein